MADLTNLDREQMARVIVGATTVSDRIRKLAAAGYERADIARFLEKRYQHVRNVLVQDEQKATRVRPSHMAGNTDEAGRRAWVTLGEGGRIVIPADMRNALGIAEGDDLQLVLEEDLIVLRTRKGVVRDLQSFFARARDPNRSVVDAFLAERRAMWGED